MSINRYTGYFNWEIGEEPFGVSNSEKIQVYEELTPYFPYSTKKRKILTTPSSPGASEI
jgi:hypothetical protein